MNPTDLAQDARITAEDLLAIVNNGDQGTAYAVDKMREAAHILGACADHIAPSAGDRDDAHGPAVADNNRRVGTASIGHDIGTDGWHREQALWADKHRSRRDDIGRG